jgi:hypothetical protein
MSHLDSGHVGVVRSVQRNLTTPGIQNPHLCGERESNKPFLGQLRLVHGRKSRGIRHVSHPRQRKICVKILGDAERG